MVNEKELIKQIKALPIRDDGYAGVYVYDDNGSQCGELSVEGLQNLVTKLENLKKVTKELKKGKIIESDPYYELKLEMYEHFGIDETEVPKSSLQEAVDYLIEGESSVDFIKSYARGYAEMAERYHTLALIKEKQLTSDLSLLLRSAIYSSNFTKCSLRDCITEFLHKNGLEGSLMRSKLEDPLVIKMESHVNDCWLSEHPLGDPPRTTNINTAKRFDTYESAEIQKKELELKFPNRKFEIKIVPKL